MTTATDPKPVPAVSEPKPVAYVPHCIADGEHCIEGEFRWEEVDEKPFEVSDPLRWECLPLYAAIASTSGESGND